MSHTQLGVQVLQASENPVLEHSADKLALKQLDTPPASGLGWAPFDQGDLSGCTHRGSTAALAAHVARAQLERARAIACSTLTCAEVAIEVRATQAEGCPHAHAGHCISERQLDITTAARRLDALRAADAAGMASHAGGADGAEVLAARVRSNGNVVIKAWSAAQVSQMAAHAHPSTGAFRSNALACGCKLAGCADSCAKTDPLRCRTSLIINRTPAM